MINAIITAVSTLCKRRLITGFCGEPYLERYSIVRTKPISIYLHKFVDSDPDRGLHDHPFEWHYSIILYGDYSEMLSEHPTKIVKRKRLRIAKFDANHKHRVILNSHHCWTIFVHGRRVKGWGFWRNGSYTPMSDGVDDKILHERGWEDSTRPISTILKSYFLREQK